MTDKNTADVKQPKNASSVNFKGSITDVKKICYPASSDIERSLSTMSQKTPKREPAQLGYSITQTPCTRQHDYQAILLHTTRDEMLDMDIQTSILESCPLAMANINIVKKPLILYQLEYL